MNKQKRIINYNKHWASDGAVYSQTVHITQKEADKLINKIISEQLKSSRPDNYEYNLYIKQPLDHKGKIIFTNLTQRDFFNRFLKANLKDRNTCFIID